MGVRVEAGRQAVTFEGRGYTGAVIDVNLDVGLEHEGLYWFDVLLDDQLLTRVPLRVVYQPHQTP